ncbi:MAG: hypothetical protein IPG91_15390 [Ideonella sp.]|nr:hypothetical protein [Ideonella sp.]
MYYLEGGNKEDTMASHCEERGQYLIEAGALHLMGASKWQSRLTTTQLCCSTGLSKNQSFPSLTPLFDTVKGAQ